jgi:hypothetical protein
MSGVRPSWGGVADHPFGFGDVARLATTHARRLHAADLHPALSKGRL